MSPAATLPKPVGFRPIPLKKSKEKTKYDTFMFCCQFICSGLCLLPLPIVQLSFALDGPIVCTDNRFPFSINVWLLVEAITSIAMFFNVIMILSCDRIFAATYIMGALFQLAWIIVGSLQFWSDCPNIQPSSVNILMWITVIFGIIRSFSSVSNLVEY
jgi:hypothetical protein